jgi:outer membrane receptor protein involved in Fe transport
VPRAEFLAAAAFLLTLGRAAEAAQRQRFVLPAGRLGDAVVALGRQANVSIGIREPALAGRRVGAVSGSMSLDQAMRRLLAGSGARPVALARGVYLIVPAPPARAASQRPRKPPRPAPPPGRPHGTAPRHAEPQPEIVVTGSRRSLLLSAYAGAAAMVDGDDPIFYGLRGSDGLTERLPSVTSTHLGPGRNKLFLRGIADSSFNGPTQATVGQYLGESRLNYTAPDPDLRVHDVRRVEVLAGPQGTLYGAGSLGGVIRILPNRPDVRQVETSASLGAALTRHGAPGGDGAALLNLPLARTKLALRLSGYAESEGGYIDDPGRGLDDVNRTRAVGGRAALRAVSGGGWTVDLAVTGQRIRGEDAQFADLEGPPLTRRSAVRQDFRSGYALADLVASREWGRLHLVSATGIVRQSLLEHYDSTPAGGPPTLFEQRNRITMLSSDTRLSRQRPGGSGWLIGFSLVSNRSEQQRALGPPGALRPITGVRNAVEEATAYGEAAARLAKGLVLTAGARFSHARVSGAVLDAPTACVLDLRGVGASRTGSSFTPSLGLTMQATRALSLFARYQEGFRPGGLAIAGEVVQRFRNDKVATGEAGLRYGPPGQPRLDASAAAALTRWRHIQADVIDWAGLPTTANIGDGRIYTLDVRLGWRPAAGLALDLGAVLNRSRVTNPAPTIIISPSSPLPNVAAVNARIGAEYERALAHGLGLRLAASARYVGSSRLGIGPILGEPQGGWLDTRLSLRLEAGRRALVLTVANLLDEEGNRFAFGSPFTLIERRQVTPLRPRTVRLGWETRF